MKFNKINKDVKRSNLKFSACDVELGDNGETAKTAPVKLIALSGKPFETPFWGKCVQDLNGMTLTKKRIAIDLEHCEPIGYINRFEVIDNQLVLNGAITPVTDEAKDTLALMKAGVPFESSIDFSPSHSEDLQIEEYTQGAVEVNGQMIDAPLTVFRKWCLRSVAICKSGADNNTESTLQKKSENEAFALTINQADYDITGKDNMIDKPETVVIEAVPVIALETPTTVQAVAEAIVAPADPVKVAESLPVALETPVEAVEAVESVNMVEAPVVKVPDIVPVQATVQTILPVETMTPAIIDDGLKADKQESIQTPEIFKQFLGAFGTEKASEFFAQGLSMVDATRKHYEFVQGQLVECKETIERQNQEIASLKEGLNKKSFKPVEFEQTKVGTVNLWQQYNQIKDSTEKTVFYRLHKNEMK